MHVLIGFKMVTCSIPLLNSIACGRERSTRLGYFRRSFVKLETDILSSKLSLKRVFRFKCKSRKARARD